MNIVKTSLNNCVIIEPKVFADERGFFRDICRSRYADLQRLCCQLFKITIRAPQKCVAWITFSKNEAAGNRRVVSGEVYDVMLISERTQVLLDAGSVILSEDNKKHQGFHQDLLIVVLSDVADFEYSQYYDPSDEGSILW